MHEVRNYVRSAGDDMIESFERDVERNHIAFEVEAGTNRETTYLRIQNTEGVAMKPQPLINTDGFVSGFEVVVDSPEGLRCFIDALLFATEVYLDEEEKAE